MLSPRVLRLLVAALCVLLAKPALAQPAKPPPAAPAPTVAPLTPPDSSWAGQIDLLSRWLEVQRKARCTERCFTLDRLRITGKVGEGPLRFELSGSVLADGPVAVPLFGPPPHVRVDDTLEDGKAAIIGFESDHYFLYTGARHFVLKGSLLLDGELALTIPGPLNALEADVTAGAVVEGARLTGLSGATVHFSREGAAQAAGPTVFQLARAVRVGREIGFEYRLTMRSGADLGVVRLPLAFGEKVLDVTGAGGWRVEDRELVLPTAGRTAEMTITGTMSGVTRFLPDARSSYEWWLLESDPEHRIKVQGDARQVDAAESPIPRSQTTSRLFLVQKGQHIEIAVTSLQGVDVLAAVVRSHDRQLALTTRGDLVSDDTLAYENNGIDYLLYAPEGRPIYLATDGKAERIMHQSKDSADVLVPLRTGSHNIRLQSMAQAALGSFGGRMELPMPSYPLTASRVSVHVGVPPRVFPIALLGGDRWVWAHDAGDLFAVALGFIVAWIAVRVPPDATRSRARWLRLLGGLVLGGLWMVSEGFYVLTLLAIGLSGLLWLLGRVLRGAARAVVAMLLLGVLGVVALGMLSMGARSPSSPASVGYSEVAPTSSPVSLGDRRDNEGRASTWNAQLATGGVLEGATPVALTLPSTARSLSASRELVTKDRPFKPVLVYLKDWAVLPLLVLWLAALVVVLAAHRAPFAAAYKLLRDRLVHEPPPPPAKQDPPAPADPPAAA